MECHVLASVAKGYQLPDVDYQISFDSRSLALNVGAAVDPWSIPVVFLAWVAFL